MAVRVTPVLTHDDEGVRNQRYSLDIAHLTSSSDGARQSHQQMIYSSSSKIRQFSTRVEDEAKDSRRL